MAIISSVASPICQEGQSERTFLIFAFSSRFFLFFPLFFPILGKFFAVRGGTLPPLTPSGYATVLAIIKVTKYTRANMKDYLFQSSIIALTNSLHTLLGCCIGCNSMFITIRRINSPVSIFYPCSPTANHYPHL